MKMKGHVGVLLLGVALGIAVSLPFAALASNWSPFSGDQGKAGPESSGTAPQPSPLDAANADTSENTPRQTNQAQQEDKHEQMHRMMDAVHGEGASQRMHEAMGEDGEKMMDQCVAMMDMMQDMEDMMGSGGMTGSGGMMGDGRMMGR